uniref:Uncharacterized protein n=1 Tax=Setaria digitata TaxID=48799 RepID=A0A915PCL3_9BILA
MASQSASASTSTSQIDDGRRLMEDNSDTVQFNGGDTMNKQTLPQSSTRIAGDSGVVMASDAIILRPLLSSVTVAVAIFYATAEV